MEWRYCLLAMVACAIGGYTSARFARMIPQPVLRGMVIVIGFGMAAWYLLEKQWQYMTSSSPRSAPWQPFTGIHCLTCKLYS